MKKIKYSIGVLLVMFATICSLTSCEEIEGDGNVVTEQRSVSTFSQLEVNGVFNLYISQGDTESVKIETDSNLLKLIETKNYGNKLTIKMETEGKNLQATRINVFLTIKNIEKFEFNMIGNIETTTALNMGKVQIMGTGVGNSKLELNSEKVDGEFSTVGTVTLKGKIQNLTLNCSGVGDLDALDLNADTLVLTSSGVGNVEVNAEKEISITSSGVGSVKYKGNAVVKEMNANGIGRVKKI